MQTRSPHVGRAPALSRREAPKAVTRALAQLLDPVRFAHDAGLTAPDPKQQDVLRSTARQMLLLCTRQWGKSTVTSLIALREAALRPPALVLAFARAQRQAAELLRKVKGFGATLGAFAPSLVAESTLSIEYENGSRIVALPGNEANVRGFSAPSLLIFDEAARVPDDLYFAARPMLAASQGRIVALSSAWAQVGWFYHEWWDGGPEWERIMVTAPECPRFTPEFLASERAAMGDRLYRREYLCEFGDTEETVFSAALIEAMFAGVSAAPLAQAVA